MLPVSKVRAARYARPFPNKLKPNGLSINEGKYAKVLAGLLAQGLKTRRIAQRPSVAFNSAPAYGAAISCRVDDRCFYHAPPLYTTLLRSLRCGPEGTPPNPSRNSAGHTVNPTGQERLLQAPEAPVGALANADDGILIVSAWLRHSRQCFLRGRQDLWQVACNKTASR